MKLEFINIRNNPDYLEKGIQFFTDSWGFGKEIYNDCIRNSMETKSPLPRWYLLINNDEIIGSYGLITNDFISRQDLYPWLCAVFIKEEFRNKGLGGKLLEHGRKEAYQLGYKTVYLATSHDGYYERYGWEHIAKGYHPWNEESKIYKIKSIPI